MVKTMKKSAKAEKPAPATAAAKPRKQSIDATKAQEEHEAKLKAKAEGEIEVKLTPEAKKALAAAARQATPAAPPPAPTSTLPIDPKAPAGAKLKDCPLCGKFQIPVRWHFCNACWDIKKAARANGEKPAPKDGAKAEAKAESRKEERIKRLERKGLSRKDAEQTVANVDAKETKPAPTVH